VRVFNLRRARSADGVRLTAAVAWEDSARSARNVWIEVSPELESALAGELDGFAVAASAVAQHHGEKRLLVEGTLCPRLAEGLAAATRLLASWFPPAAPAPAIESRGTAPRFPPPEARSAVFLSGGIDSLFAVAQNRDRFPRDHPASFRDAVVVEGYIFGEAAGSERAIDYWGRTRRAAASSAKAADLDPLFVRTNLRMLEDEVGFFAAKSHSSLLAAVAHLLSRRISSASVAADLDVSRLRAWGSHPVLDPLYSGSALAVLHSGIETSRVGKAARIAAWPEALGSLMVCTEGPLSSGALNCGRCEKCVRTLAALGPAAAAAASFERTEIAPAAIDRLRPGLHPWAVAGFWTDLADTFRSKDRSELAAAADRFVARAGIADAWRLDRGWKGALRRFDRRFLGSRLLRTSRRVRRSA
jgi:hypothetical protein